MNLNDHPDATTSAYATRDELAELERRAAGGVMRAHDKLEQHKAETARRIRQLWLIAVTALGFGAFGTGAAILEAVSR